MLNDNIYVPFFGNASYDDDAIAAYEAAAPGYTVRGYYYSGFLSDDALHCRAKGVMDRAMLRVAHVPIVDDQIGAVDAEAFVHDHSNLGISAVDLHYRQSGGPWQSAAMAHQGDGIYLATIPTPAVTGDTDYYILAASNSGRQEGMPRVAPAHWYSFLQEGTTDVADLPAGAPAALHGNYPNPFNPSTTFSFELLYADHAELSVFDAQGRLVRRLVDGLCEAGRTEVRWDGRDDAGRTLPSGLYLYRLRAAGLEYSRPALLLK
jgi:hypothetical protein